MSSLIVRHKQNLTLLRHKKKLTTVHPAFIDESGRRVDRATRAASQRENRVATMGRNGRILSVMT